MPPKSQIWYSGDSGDSSTLYVESKRYSLTTCLTYFMSEIRLNLFFLGLSICFFTVHVLQEAGNLRLEAQVQPANDPNLSIEWFKNGVQLATGKLGAFVYFT